MRPPVAPQPPTNLVWFDEVDSTNLVAARLVASWGEDDEAARLADTLVLAGRQSAGRGRGGKTWLSPPGGLYASWLGWLPVAALDTVPLAAGVCLAEAVESEHAGVAVGLKWPNDLVCASGKLGGILCQSRSSGDAAWVIVGLGVNVQAAPSLGRGAGRAACLAELGWSGETGPACWRLASAFVAGLRPALTDPARTLAAWSRRSVHVAGELLQVQLGAETARGRFTGFGPRGELLLEIGGSVRAIGAGSLVAALEP